MIDEAQQFLIKAEESLAGAESEFANGRYANTANRCYYACFQAAIAALIRDGIRPAGGWSHSYVQSQFVGQLVNRRKRYPSDLRDVLIRNMELRHAADYFPRPISRDQTRRALDRARRFVTAILEGSTLS